MKRKTDFSIYLLTILFLSANSQAIDTLDTINSDHQLVTKGILKNAHLDSTKINNKTVARAFKKNEVALDADFTTNVVAARALELFSEQPYDNYLFSLFMLDLGLNAKQYNLVDQLKYHLKASIRTKNIVGNTSNPSLLKSKPIKIGIGRTESEVTFEPKYLMAWFRELWLKYIYNEKYNSSVAIGYKPKQIGYGIALGNGGDKLGRFIPGLDRYQDIDQFRLGIELTGDFSDKLGYDAYLGVIDNKCTRFLDTAQISQFQNLETTKNHNRPYRDEFTNNLVGSLQLTFRPSSKHSDVTVKPYLVLNRDGEQQVEYLGDASSMLGILGCETNIKKGQLNFRMESGLNLGYQKVKAWDRDIVYFASSPYHLYMFQDFGDPGTPHWRVAERTPYPEELMLSKGNGVVCRDSLDTGIRYKNAYDRFRRGYKNQYQGFFLVGEASYDYVYSDQATTTIGTLAGFITGDENPNDDLEMLLARRLDGTCTDACPGCFEDCWPNHCFKDHDKTYQGFTGVQQLFNGSVVKSVFMMEAHKLNQPLSAHETMITYPILSNLAFLGIGATYKHRAFDRIFDISGNGLLFCTPHREQKGFNYGLETFFRLSSCGEQETLRQFPNLLQDAETPLSRFLGAELNGSISLQFDPNLKFFCQAAVFLPGLYYEDAQGKVIRLSEQFKLAESDFSGYELNPQKYRWELGNTCAILANVGFEYHFSS